MKDYMKRFMIALLMALCVSLLMIGGGLAQSRNEKKQSLIHNSHLEEIAGRVHTDSVARQQSM
ncbi:MULTISPECIES: hypothetical protein [Bacillaceae]|uniref:hypothetical protein n=1 Tax=Bacillaceae TaxID=186817 RepID=UPI000E76B361|nr:hypothetical protein [Bacillus sp. PK3_68]RJS59586.1 hypothetical protein CJ483_05540 [Bacillus sp. PK3_68]